MAVLWDPASVDGVPDTWNRPELSNHLATTKWVGGYVANALGSAFSPEKAPQLFKDLMAYTGVEASVIDPSALHPKNLVKLTPDKGIYIVARYLADRADYYARSLKDSELSMDSSFKTLVGSGRIHENAVPDIFSSEPLYSMKGLPLAEKRGLEGFGTVTGWMFSQCNAIRQKFLMPGPSRRASSLVSMYLRLPVPYIANVYVSPQVGIDTRQGVLTKAAGYFGYLINWNATRDQALAPSNQPVSTGYQALAQWTYNGMLGAANAIAKTLDWAFNIDLTFAELDHGPVSDKQVSIMVDMVKEAYLVYPDISATKGIWRGGDYQLHA